MEPIDLENAYSHYMSNLHKHLPDGILDVDLNLLQELNILSSTPVEETEEDTFTYNFYVIESEEKITLFNDKFSIWIVPKLEEEKPMTYTLIAVNDKKNPHLEMVFTTHGVYNHSSLVLKLLEKFLEQIEENEEELRKIDGKT